MSGYFSENEFQEGPFTFDPLPDRNTHPGILLSFFANAMDQDGDQITYSLLNAPPGAQLDPNSGFFSWTPAAQQLGVFNLAIQATENGASLVIVRGFRVNVINQPPQIDSIPPHMVNVNRPFRLHVNACDPERDLPLSFSVLNGPGTIDNTGLYTFTPSQAGNTNVTVQVVDSLGGAAQVTFSITAQ
jgi:hypothetical protein